MKLKAICSICAVVWAVGCVAAFAQRRSQESDSRHSGPPRQKSEDAADVEEADPDAKQVVKLGEIPKLDLPKRSATTEKESTRIEELIRQLAEIENPDFGFAATFSGTNFAPIPGIQQSGTMLISKNELQIDHSRQEVAAFRELVALGAKSIPFLLKALDNKSPTKLTMTHKSSFGGMWHSNDLSGNPLNRIEAAVVAETAKDRRLHADDHIDSYTVKVGDVCFVALGQIVGRSYSAVRYQPTACIIINSPTSDAKLCAQVRAIWHSEDANKTLFESLLIDYATRGIFNGESLDGWSGSNFQCDAATRLLYYYPEATSMMIAERLRTCDVSKAKDVNVFISREVRSGVRVKDFIAAIRWSKNPSIVAALRDAHDRSDDAKIRKAIVPTLKPANKTKARKI